jgi:hypothetical protein
MKILIEIDSDMVDWIDNQVIDLGLDEQPAVANAPYLRGQLIQLAIRSGGVYARSIKDFLGSRN